MKLEYLGGKERSIGYFEQPINMNFNNPKNPDKDGKQEFFVEESRIVMFGSKSLNNPEIPDNPENQDIFSTIHRR